MPSRSFAGIQTVSGSPQPAFGTTTTAASVPVYDKFAGNQTGANPSQTTLTVTSTKGFRSNVKVLICSAFPFVGSPNIGIVVSVVDATHMTVSGLNQSVASGAFVVLAQNAMSISIDPVVGNTGNIYLGTASTVSATDASVIKVIEAPTSPTYAYNVFHAETTSISESYNTEDYWVNGTANDKFLASYAS